MEEEVLDLEEEEGAELKVEEEVVEEVEEVEVVVEEVEGEEDKKRIVLLLIRLLRYLLVSLLDYCCCLIKVELKLEIEELLQGKAEGVLVISFCNCNSRGTQGV